MSIFVDTSALFAILDADDLNHAQARDTWSRLLADTDELISTNYILVETLALVQRRLGMEAVKTLQDDVAPVLTIEWMDAPQHAVAINELIATGHRQISLVDWTSFGTMRRLRLRTAFAFDQDFRAQGFETIPAMNEPTPP